MNWFAPKGFSNFANLVLAILVVGLAMTAWLNLREAAQKQAGNSFLSKSVSVFALDTTEQCTELRNEAATSSFSANRTLVVHGPLTASARVSFAVPLDENAKAAGGAGVFQVQGERVIGEWLGSETCGWYFVGERLAPYEQTIPPTLIAILAAGLAAGLTIWWIGRVAQRRLETDIARVLADCREIGSGNLTHRIDGTIRSDDLRAVAAEVNGMVGQLALLVENMRTVSVTLAHDMRNYITHAKVRLRQLRDALPEGDRSAVEPAMVSLSQLDALSREIARMAASRSDGNAGRVVDLADIARDAAGLFADSFEDEGVTLATEFNAAPVKVNQALVMEAIVNLLGNALKYGASGKHVMIRTACDGAQAIAEVIDSGPGVPEAQRDKIFRLDYRLNNEGPVEGHGFGLAIAKMFTRMDGGDLTVTDAHPHAVSPGACFRISFPVHTAD
ncbi:sensor histidine kinase [Erythrobacter donghaensis]|uniref:sensor histidine kinase n=1 Tax=Erythrobacter donghaensis TaxID=267135 RepID=UPI00093CF784|nr:HAMP domain-containing sensor histidine kinase [Erythrobacter donghaensis]